MIVGAGRAGHQDGQAGDSWTRAVLFSSHVERFLPQGNLSSALKAFQLIGSDSPRL